MKAEDIVRTYDGLCGVVTELADLANHLPAAQASYGLAVFASQR